MMANGTLTVNCISNKSSKVTCNTHQVHHLMIDLEVETQTSIKAPYLSISGIRVSRYRHSRWTICMLYFRPVILLAFVVWQFGRVILQIESG